MKMFPRILSIAALDTSVGAGMTADLSIMKKLGALGCVALTGICIEEACGCIDIKALDSKFLLKQIRSCVRGGINAVKIGALLSSKNIEIVAKEISRLKVPCIVDPVLRAERGGKDFLVRGTQKLFLKKLLPYASCVTPNLNEAEWMLGKKIKSVGEMKLACVEIYDISGVSVFLKGGHLPGVPIDFLYDGKKTRRFRGKRIQGPSRHGGGCRVSSAMAVYMAKGFGLEEAVAKSRRFGRPAREK